MSPAIVRALVRAWSAGLVVLLALPAGAALWERLDRRPAWVAAAFVHVTAPTPDEARRAERAATAHVLRSTSRGGASAVEPHAADESSAPSDSGDPTSPARGITYAVDRTVVVRAAGERQLLRIEDELGRIPGVAGTTPRRALRLSDLLFGFVLVALLLGFATLERSALSDADPFAQRPPLVVLNLLALSMLGTGAALTRLQGARLPLAVCVLLACVPPAIWLARTRAPWRAASLGGRWTATAVASGLVAALWLVRFAQP